FQHGPVRRIACTGPFGIWEPGAGHDVACGIRSCGRGRGPALFGSGTGRAWRWKAGDNHRVVTTMQTGIEKPISEETIRRAMGEFQISINQNQVILIQQYMAILRRWNEKLNLTAIRDPLEILYRHFCESMFGASAIPVDKVHIADIGSGPGFPGIPLKIARPELQLVLVESNIKKGTFLAEVVRELELTDTRVMISRYEELGEEL